MKKITLLLTGIILGFAVMNAQDLTLSWEGEPLGDTVYVFGSQWDAEIVSHAVVTNNTSAAIEVKVLRTRLEMQDPPANSQFCWAGSCYPPNMDLSGSSTTIGAGESSDEENFSGHYIPAGVWGASYIKYKFFDVNNEDTYVEFVAVYSATVSGIEDEEAASVSLYPNPAVDKVTFESTSRIKKISIYDLTGKMLSSTPANDTKTAIDISFLDKGLYLVRLDTESGTRVEKLYKQ